MNIYNLYITPYSIDDKFNGEMDEFIMDKYQRLKISFIISNNMFQNHYYIIIIKNTKVNILMNIIICLIHILIQKKKIQ